MIFTPVSTSKFKDKLPPPKENLDQSLVIQTDPNPWLDRLGLSQFKNKVYISCLYGWILPGDRLNIHKDISKNGVSTPWSLVFCPEDQENLMIEIYENSDNAQIESMSAPRGFYGDYTIDKLPFESAIKIDEWSMANGSVIFNPGKYWHSAFNPTNEIIHVISLRNYNIVTEKLIKLILKKN